MPAPGDWTTEDLDALPDDGRRHELIDGVHTVSPSPTPLHQFLAMQLGVALHAACPPDYAATQATDVRISDRRSLSPNVLVVTRESLKLNSPHFRPGDVLLPVEIVSPSTRTTDRITKPALYAEAGIPFYWRIETTGTVSVITHHLDVATGAYVLSAEFDDVIRTGEPFPIVLPIATITL